MAETKIKVVGPGWTKVSESAAEDWAFLVQHHRVSGRVEFAYTNDEVEPEADLFMFDGKDERSHQLAPGQAYSREFQGWFWMRAEEPTPVSVTQ